MTDFPGARLTRRAVVRWEERAQGLFVPLRLERVVHAYRPRPRHRGTRLDGREQPGEVRVGRQRLGLALEHARGTIEPSPSRDVGDRVALADDPVAPGEVVVEHAVVALRLATVAVAGVVRALGRGEPEVHRLARERAEPRGDEQEPGEQLGPVLRHAEEAARLLGEVEQDRRRVEDADLAPARPLRVDDGGHLAVRVDRAEGGRVLLAPARVDGDRLVGEAEFLQQQRDLRGVGCRVIVETDHRGSLVVQSHGASGRASRPATARR